MSERATNHGTTAAPTAPATYQDILDAPEHLVAELIFGMLHTHPRPAPRHASAEQVSCASSAAFHDGRAAREGGGSSTSSEFHLREVRRTLPGGAASA